MGVGMGAGGQGYAHATKPAITPLFKHLWARVGALGVGFSFFFFQRAEAYDG